MTLEELISYLQRVAAKEDTLRPLLGTLKALNPGAVISGAAMGSVTSLFDFEHETAAPLPEKMLLAAEFQQNEHSALARVHAGFGRRCNPCNGVTSCVAHCAARRAQNKNTRTNI
jgi:hypothetical protein